MRASYSTAGKRELVLTRRLAKPIEKVWAALTVPARLAEWMGWEWLSDLATPLSLGGRFDYRFNNTDMISEGRVLRFEPPCLLEHSWFENQPPGAVVCWALEPDGEGCVLTLTHRFGAPDDAPRAAAGWTMILDQLAGSFGEAAEAGGDWRAVRDRYAMRFPPEATRDGRLTLDGDTPVLRFSRIVQAPAKAVWDALTTQAGLARWLQAEATVDGVVGGRFHLLIGGASRVDGEITRWEPPTLLEYTWPEREANGDSLLTFWLRDFGPTTEVILTHRLNPGCDLRDFAAGWHWHLDCLDDGLESRTPTFDPQRFAVLQKIYAATLGAPLPDNGASD
jgi:uncharacterized protein YndB with AHSA1/START domain